jgi:hypothetical protein
LSNNVIQSNTILNGIGRGGGFPPHQYLLKHIERKYAMIKNVVGIDVGYGLTKAYNGNKKTVVFKSVIGQPEQITFKLDDIFNHQHKKNNNGTINIDGSSYFVGENAILQSRLNWSIRDRNRSYSDIKILTLAAMSQLGISGNVSVMTGLPVKWYNQKEQLSNNLLGNYTVNGQTINITDCKVIVQPIGSYFSILFGNNGTIQRPEFIHKKIGVIDIGMYTTDIIIMNGANFIEGGSDSTTIAMAKLYELTINAIEKKHDLTLNLTEVEKAIKNNYITVQGQQHSLTPITEPILNTLKKTIYGYISNIWADYHKQLDCIFLSGGGASTLAPYLKDHFPQLEQISDSHIANVLGYYRYNCFLHNRGQ